MKGLIIAVVGAGIAAGALVYLNRPKPVPVSTPEPTVESAPAQVSQERTPPELSVAQREHPAPPPESSANPKLAQATAATSTYASLEASRLNGEVDLLVSPQATHEQKQAVWKRLRESGKIDLAIRELE